MVKPSSASNVKLSPEEEEWLSLLHKCPDWQEANANTNYASLFHEDVLSVCYTRKKLDDPEEAFVVTEVEMHTGGSYSIIQCT